MKRFNVTGLCTPEEDYMVDISGKVAEIKQLVDRRCYFIINRARQYGKTTTLNMLKRALASEYICLSLSFEGVGTTMFENAQSFCRRFLWQLELAAKHSMGEHEPIEWQNDKITDFDELSVHLTQICANRKIVLMIDEVDRASNYRVFLLFLGMLRNKFNERKSGMGASFHSVILAGLHDIRNIKSKMISEGSYTPAETEDKKYDSPWNIAVNFEVDMSFNPNEISTMLKEYETEHNTGMNISEISEEIYDYTAGYPFLVSRICQCIDEELDKNWKVGKIREAVQIIIEEKNMLFDDLFKNLENSADLYELMYEVLIVGNHVTFTYHNPTVNLGFMHGIIKKGSPYAVISNKIFELVICEYFISKDERKKTNGHKKTQRDMVRNNKFDMELCLRKFADHYAEIFNENDIKFLERHGRLIFLTYLRPLINGQGFYHIESQFTDLRRMDIVVDFGNEQFIIELKLWRGEDYERKAYDQLLSYMDSKKAETGYLLIFDFRKETDKEPAAEWIELDGKRVFEITV
ncbi:MAG: AAA-like domain-containing protein [Oscillospiraceae bacterium]|nr:AAA-like domain-containing protein [Oscillospiraceae bacterium]